MTKTPENYSPTRWYRTGGRELQFFATDDEMQQWLATLPEKYAPYTLWRTQLIQKSRRYYEPIVVTHPLFEWNAACPSFFLHSEVLMPPFPVGDEIAKTADAWASLNGLVLVQHGSMRKSQQQESRIAFISKIRNIETNEPVVLKDRAALYNALHKMIKRKLCFKSIHTFRDGHTEESDFPLMTKEAADLAEEGYFTCMPGQRIDC